MISTIVAVLAGSVAAAATQEGPEPDAATQQSVAPAEDSGTVAEGAPALRYWLPDLPPNALTYDGERVWMRPVIAVLPDYTFFSQDDASLTQVGEQEDSWDLRTARLALLLRSKSSLEWNAFFAVDYQERRNREDQVFQIYDFRVGLPIGPVNLMIGKQKEPFVFEMTSLSVYVPQQERILSPFFVSRSTGVKLFGQLGDDRSTWAVGWFNDWLDSGNSFDKNGNDYVARVTRLVTASADDLDYFHLGLGFRRVGADAGTMQFSGRPESNVADRYLDTGEFAANHASQVSFEALWNIGSVMLAAEHVEAWVDAPSNGDPRFRGSYLMLSWMLTGESRPYDRAVGLTGPAIPSRYAGAVELVTRYSRIDLADGTIDGGRLHKWHLGINWWASAEWKIGVSYGDADLDQGGLVGNTRILLLRLQWVY